MQGFFFERAKRAFGLEEVERAVEEAKRREVAEKEQKKAKRKFSRGGKVTDSGRALHGAPSCFVLVSGYFY